MVDQSAPESSQPDQQVVAPPCPVGESHCVVIDQVVTLHHEVSQLAQQVRTDTLTGLYNFRHLRLSLEQEMERTRRSGQPTALIMIDLDHFKLVNDNWGHEVGNQALVSTAEVIRECIRRVDIPCRYGGEEFTLILPATDLMAAKLVAERVRSAIQAKPIIAEGKDIELTASLGLDIFHPLQEDTPEQLIRRADLVRRDAIPPWPPRVASCPSSQPDS